MEKSIVREIIDEMNAKLKKAIEERVRLEEQRKALAKAIFEELVRLRMWKLVRLAGYCRSKGHGDWCELELELEDGVKLALDTYNGFVHMWIGRRLAFMGHDGETIYVYIKSLDLAEKALEILRRMPGEVGELVDIAEKAGYYGDEQLKRDITRELRRLLEVVEGGDS